MTIKNDNMKSIKNLLFLAIGMMALVSVSCSNESEQKKNETLEVLQKDDPKFTLIDSKDVNYSMLNEYGEYIIANYTVEKDGKLVWGDPTIEQLQHYFEITYPDNPKRPTVLCHHHSSSSTAIHYITVRADNGSYYGVMVDDNYNPPKVNLYPFGDYNPCGLLGTL